MSHKCAKPSCQFRLPDTYPLPLCPWHAAPGKGPVKVASAIGILIVGVGGRFAYDKIRDALKRRKTEAAQKEWRERTVPERPTKEEGDDSSSTGKVA